MTATTVRSVPWMTCSLSPISRTSLMTCSICVWVEPGFMTTIMALRSVGEGGEGIGTPETVHDDLRKTNQPQDRVLRLLQVAYEYTLVSSERALGGRIKVSA